VAGYKIKSSKSVAFLYTNDKQAEKENREITPFTIVTNNIKYLGGNSNQRSKSMTRTSSLSRKKSKNNSDYIVL
jgi:predicted DNA-binding transcriptional regulator YafY